MFVGAYCDKVIRKQMCFYTSNAFCYWLQKHFICFKDPQKSLNVEL